MDAILHYASYAGIIIVLGAIVGLIIGFAKPTKDRR